MPTTDYGRGHEKILKAATELFFEKGYKSTTLKDVAKRSGANTALVSYHFGGKWGLREAVIEACMQMIRDSLNQFMSDSKNFTVKGLQRLTVEHFKMIKEHQAFYQLCLWRKDPDEGCCEAITENFYVPIFSVGLQLMKKICPKLSDKEVEIKMFILTSMFEKYGDLVWFTPEVMKTKNRPKELLKNFEEQVLKLIPQILR